MQTETFDRNPRRMTGKAILTEAMIREASSWNFNCGPGAICAVLGKTPEEIRPHLFDFEQRGYTNPTLMHRVLCGLEVCFNQTYRSDDPEMRDFRWPTLGLVRIQWGGPWTKPGVPMRVRYRKTHWVGLRIVGDNIEVFDINAVHDGGGCDGWIDRDMWEKYLVPIILRDCVPRADGTWWVTHCLEVQR